MENPKLDSLDIYRILNTIYAGKRSIISITIIFIVFGLLVAILSGIKFKSSTVFVAQGSGTNSSAGLSGLASLAGVNLGALTESSGLIPPNLYFKIVESSPFKKELINTPLTFEYLEEPTTYKEYFLEHYRPDIFEIISEYTVGLPTLIYESINSNKSLSSQVTQDGLDRITKTEMDLFELMGTQLSLKVDEADNYISITFEMPERLAAAQMAQKALELLQEYIVDFKVERSKAKLDFIEDRFQEKKEEYMTKQEALNGFLDKNLSLSTASARAELKRLQTEHDLAFNIYSQLANQLELQKIETQEDTPVFTIINPVSVPVEKSRPKRLFILMVFGFLGVLVSIGWVFIRDQYPIYKQKWISSRNQA